MKTKLMKLEDLKDDQKIVITKAQLLEMSKEMTTNAVGLFIKQCGEMAEANWCPEQVNMLERLFDKVLKGEPYAEAPEED